MEYAKDVEYFIFKLRYDCKDDVPRVTAKRIRDAAEIIEMQHKEILKLQFEIDKLKTKLIGYQND